MPLWLKPSILMLLFYLSAMIQVIKQNQLLKDQIHMANTALELINCEFKYLVQLVTYTISDAYTCGKVQEGSLINVMMLLIIGKTNKPFNNMHTIYHAFKFSWECNAQVKL